MVTVRIRVTRHALHRAVDLFAIGAMGLGVAWLLFKSILAEF